MRDDLNALELRGSPHAPIQRLSLAEFDAHWGATLCDPRYCWRIVELDEQPVGFGLIYLTAPLTKPALAFLHWAYLAESARRAGLGSALVENLLAWAKSQGADRVELQFIDGNVQAEAFWTQKGFRPYARKCVHQL